MKMNFAATAMIAFVVGLLLILVLTGCDDRGRSTRPTTTTTTTTTTVSDPVINQIAGMTSCADLQARFDVSYEAHQHASSNNTLDAMRTMTARMTAADNRMREIGCYR
jgi:hypothetical protein